MKKLFKTLLVVQLIIYSVLIIASCGDDSKTEYSPNLTETAIVLQTVHTPSTHETVFEPSFGGGGGIGFGPSGVGVKIGSGLQVTSVDNPEKFAAVFRCKHGEFISERKEFYDKLKGHEGDTVTVT